MKIVSGIMLFLIIGFFSLGSQGFTKVNSSSSAKNSVVPDSTKTANLPESETGIGPIKELKLGAIDKKLVAKGKNIFNSKCMACHQLDNRLVGPPLRNITKQLKPLYIMNYLLNTTVMQKKDPELKKLIKKFNGVLMPDQNLKEKQAREVLEYLRSVAK